MSSRLPVAIVAPAALAAVTLGLIGTIASRTVETHPRITTQLLWAKDIAPILQRRCFQCHSPNNNAMSFTTYTDARPWAAAIREEVLLRHMPPWSAQPGFGRFENDPSLTQSEWDLLVAWVDGGSPSGTTLVEEAKAPLPTPLMADWDHEIPPTVIAADEAYAVPAGAAPEVKRFEMATGFKTAQKVHAIAFKPGDRRVVRYAAVYESGTNRWLFTWTPWFRTMHLPEGTAFTLPANARLTVEIGYRGTEENVSDWSEVGLFTDEAVTGVVTTTTLAASPATVAPGAAPTRTRAELVLDQTTGLKAVWPEVPAGTTSVELTAYLPDGNVRPLLWLRDVRIDWPSSYVFADAVPLPKGAKLVMTAYVTNATLAPLTTTPRLHLLRVPTTATTF